MSVGGWQFTGQRFGGALFVVFSLAYGWFAGDIQQLPVDALEAMSARSLPYALAVVGVLLGVALLVLPEGAAADDMAADDGSGAAGSDDKVEVRRWLPVLALLASVSAYALALEWLGFVLATAMFLTTGFVLLGERRPWLLLLGALPLALALWLVLSVGLGIYLAPGRLFGG